MVLSAVFLPMAFFGGSTGVIYRQFSMTIVSAMVLSVIVALVLSPALDRQPAQAQPRDGDESCLGKKAPAYRTIGSKAGASGSTTVSTGWSIGTRCVVQRVIDRKWLFLAIYGAVVRCSSSCCSRGFRPASCRPRTRAGAGPVPLARGRDAELERTQVAAAVEEYFLNGPEAKNVEDAIHRRRRRRRRRPARIPARASSTSPTGTSARARRTAPTRSSSAHRRHSAAFATRSCSR